MHSSPEALNHRPQRWLKPAGLIGVGAVSIVVAAGLVSRGIASQQLKGRTLAEAVPIVDVVMPAADSQAEKLTLPGDVQAYENAVIHARVSGYLKRWYVDIGAHVKAGQRLADIDTPELDQQLEQAKANLATASANQRLARTTAARWQSLLASDGVSRQEADEKAGDLDAKTSLVQAAKADLDRLQALESFKRIVAPFDGVVTARNTDIGALIAAGNPSDPGLFTVADMHRLRIYVRVPQNYSADVKPGDIATLSVPQYPGRTFKATLASTSESVSTQSGALLAELQMDNSDGLLKPGDYAQAQFSPASSSGVVRVPASALMFLQKGMAVAVVGPGRRVQMKPIVVQRDLGTSVEVAGGLSPHDAVIDNPPDSLIDGEQVRVAGPASRQKG
jgi:multidrug efflux system membrane fusion protein